MRAVLVDSSVVLDLFTADPEFYDRSLITRDPTRVRDAYPGVTILDPR